MIDQQAVEMFNRRLTHKVGWYSWLEQKLGPTELIVNLVLLGLILVSVLILLQPSRTLKALWVAYWVSP